MANKLVFTMFVYKSGLEGATIAYVYARYCESSSPKIQLHRRTSNVLITKDACVKLRQITFSFIDSVFL